MSLSRRKSQEASRRPSKLQTNLEKQAEEDFEAADVQRAEQFENASSFRRSTPDGSYEKFPVCFDNDVLSEFSLGVYFYFSVLKATLLVFLAMSVVAALLVGANFSGSGLAEAPSSAFWDMTTLANQNITFKGDSQTKSLASNPKTHELAVVAYTALLLFACLILRVRYFFTARSHVQEHPTPAAYAVEVTGLPEKHVKEEDVAEHFGQFGAVAEVAFARKLGGSISLFEKQRRLFLAMKKEETRKRLHVFRSSRRLDVLKGRHEVAKQAVMEKLAASGHAGVHSLDDYAVQKAFVVFGDVESKAKMIGEYRRRSAIRTLKVLGCCWCCLRDRDPRFTFRFDHPLTIRQPDEPENIIWEHLETGLASRAARWALVGAFAVLLLLLDFALICIAVGQSPAVDPDLCARYLFDYSGTTEAPTKLSPEGHHCFCAGLPSDRLSQPSLVAYCKNYFVDQLSSYVPSVALSVYIPIVNTVFHVLVERLTTFLRFRSRNEESVATAMLTFVFVFFNNAVLPLVAYSNWFGVAPASLIFNFFPLAASKQWTVLPSDINRAWYLQIGSKIFLTQLVNVFSPNAVYLVWLSVHRKMRHWRMRNAIIQEEMNSLVGGPPYSLSAVYAHLLAAVFVNLFFATGVPSLVVLCAAKLGFTYLSERYILVKHAAKPPPIDGRLNVLYLRLVPLAIVFHLVVGTYMLSSPTIFPASGTTTTTVSDGEAAVLQVFPGSNGIVERYLRFPFMSALLVATVVLLLVDFVIHDAFWTLMRVFSPSIEESGVRVRSFVDEFPRMKALSVASYNILKNGRYKRLFESVGFAAPQEDTEQASPKHTKRASVAANTSDAPLLSRRERGLSIESPAPRRPRGFSTESPPPRRSVLNTMTVPPQQSPVRSLTITPSQVSIAPATSPSRRQRGPSFNDVQEPRQSRLKIFPGFPG